MEDKIIEILQKEQFNITDEAGNAYNVVEEDDFKDIAERIVKLFVLPSVFSPDEMIAFGNFIRDNYYVAGSPKMLSYHPEKYPHAKVDEIFVYWCLENGR